MNNSLIGLVIRETHEHRPWDQRWATTPRTQRDAGLPVEPLPDHMTFMSDARPLHTKVDTHVFIVAVVAIVAVIVITVFKLHV